MINMAHCEMQAEFLSIHYRLRAALVVDIAENKIIQVSYHKEQCMYVPRGQYYYYIIIIIINFSQRHGLHERQSLQTCSPKYKHTYTTM